MKVRYRNKGISGLTGFFLLLGIIIMLTPLKNMDSHLKKAAPLETASELTASDFQAGGSYDLGEVIVLDSYAYASTNDDINTNYYAVLFAGANDEPYLISLAVSTEDDIYQELLDFANDDTQFMGDISVNVCGIAQEFDSEDDTLQGFYQEFQDNLYSEGIEVTAIPLELIYKGEDAAAFRENTNGDWTTAIVTTVIIEVVGLVFLVIGILLGRRDKGKKQRKETDDGPAMNGPEIL